GKGLTSTVKGLGAGLFGVGGGSGDPFANWLSPGSVFLTGYGPNASPASALSCALPACDPSKLINIEFIGRHTTTSGKVGVPNDCMTRGPAVGFAWQLPWLGEGKTTVRGGYQITYGGTGRLIGGGFANTTEFVIGAAPGANSIANLNNYLA